MRKAILLAVLSTAVLWSAGPGRADEFNPQLSFSGLAPTEGESIVVSLKGVADPTQWTAIMIYRPNSRTEHRSEVKTFTADGYATWLLEKPGLIKVAASGPDEKAVAALKEPPTETNRPMKKVEKTIAVKFSATPVSGVVIFLLAGLILFGGAGLSLFKALRES